ncbi:MAG TPA: hypothetical protein VFQ88_08230 [Nevskiaceae bacterium]|nr:hypothetical protein [Nevskiaceae bacterium]
MPDIHPAPAPQCRIAADHPCLAGHFPGAPIVPAVVLLERVGEALRDRLNDRMANCIVRAKFLHPLHPEEIATFDFQVDADATRARFQCRVESRVIARGELAVIPVAHG